MAFVNIQYNLDTNLKNPFPKVFICEEKIEQILNKIKKNDMSFNKNLLYKVLIADTLGLLENKNRILISKGESFHCFTQNIKSIKVYEKVKY